MPLLFPPAPSEHHPVAARLVLRMVGTSSLCLMAAGLLGSCSNAALSPAPSPPLLTPIPAATLPPISTPGPESAGALVTFAPVPAVSDEDWTRGTAGAPVTLVVYSDFQCEPCADLADTLSQILALHPDQVLLVYRHYPLVTNHDKAAAAAQAAESAGAQGLFWEMHDLLYSRQAEWLTLSSADFEDWLVKAGSEVGVDTRALQEDLDSERFKERAQGAFRDAVAAGIPGVPFLFVNGQDFRIPPSLIVLSAAVRLESLRPRQYASPPPMVITPGAEYAARVDTSAGEIALKLYADSAPIAVNDFVYLAREGWFDQTYFHHVVPGILLEGGDPSGTGLGDPGYSFAMEFDPLLDFDQPGMVALSAESPGINSSRFFITLSPQPTLNGSRTIIGRVTEGLPLLEALPARDALIDLLNEPPLTIRSIHIEGP